MSNDPFNQAVDSLSAPAAVCFAIIPNDAGNLPLATKALYVGAAGDVTLRSVRASADVTFKNVQAGAILDVRVLAVRSAGTTASDLVGLA